MNVKPALYAMNVAALVTDDALFRKAFALASPTRKEKAARYRRREDAALSLGVELLLRYAYARAGMPFPKRFITSANGKPFGGELFFNLSHSGEWALCAVANGEVGCDVEKIDPAHLRIAERFYSATENEQLAAADNEEERVLRFFRMWTLKESFIKAADAHVDSMFSGPTVILGEPSRIEGESVTVAEYTELPGYACAACSYSGEELPPLQILELRDLL